MPAEDKPARIRGIQQQPPADLGLVARLGAKARSYADRAKAAETRLAELESYKTSADAELAKFRAERDPSAVALRAEKAEAELRTLRHRGAFDRIAAESGARPEAVADIYQLSGYKPEADAIDEAALRAAVDAQKAARPYLFGAAGETPQPAPGAAPGTTADLPPGPGAARGGSALKGPQKFTDAQLSDPAFVMRNYKAVTAAARDSVDRLQA